jgi:D-3-phosphoglycerate dehydrogenase / 2-oxoglutarate reductase
MSYRVAIGPSSFGDEDDTPLRMLADTGADIVPNLFGRRLTEEEIIAHLDGVDGLIAGLEPLNRRVLLSAHPRLVAIARVGIGMDNVDLATAGELGIQVSNTPEEPTKAVAEMTLAALLALCRRLVPASAALHQGYWQKSIGLGLAGLQVLLVGYGRIGRRVGELLRVFGAEILVADPFVTSDSLTAGERYVTLDNGLLAADVISLHASGADLLLGANEFARMRDGVILLNSARAELVDEDALIRALESGKVRIAWFDVFWREPYQGPLLAFDQVLLTPHMATYTRQCRLSMEVAAVENLLRDLQLADKGAR